MSSAGGAPPPCYKNNTEYGKITPEANIVWKGNILSIANSNILNNKHKYILVHTVLLRDNYQRNKYTNWSKRTYYSIYKFNELYIYMLSGYSYNTLRILS